MIKDTHNKKGGAYRSIMGLVFLGFLVFGLFLAIPAKTAEAVENYENAYIRFTSFYYDATDDLILEFYVKTTFSWKDSNTTYFLRQTYLDNSAFEIEDPGFNNVNLACEPDPVGGQFLAGQTYKIYLKYILKSGYPYPGVGLTKSLFETLKGSAMDVDDYLQNYNTTYNFFGYVVPAYTIFAYYEVKPELTITFPQENAEIADAFYVQGSYTLPAGSALDTLLVMVNEIGLYDVVWYGFFQDNLEPLSGNINVRVSGVASGDYEIFFSFIEYEDDSNIFISPVSIPIKIVDSIPPELPYTGESPPPIFTSLDPETFYIQTSNYATSTLLFNSFTDALKPLIVVIGDNLTFFSNQFNQDDAKQAGQRAGEGVLLIRAYAGNINSFFSDLPISEVLFLYLSALVAVIVFRIIRLLLKLIPFT